MASFQETVVRLPIRGGHNYADVAGRDSARQHLGDSYVINQSGFNIHSDAHITDRVDFTGHYSSAALRPVVSYVARPELQMQMKERLHDTLEQRGRSSKVLVVCGLGGAGKSQLALSYIESYRDDYTAVFWVDAGAKTHLEADYKQIRNLLHSSKLTDIEFDTCVTEVKQWCHDKQGRWLFVFDSADDIDDPRSSAYIDLRKVIIDTPSADVIVTTRSQSAKDITELEAVQVAELTSVEARDLFLRRSKLPSPSRDVCEEIDAIAEELGFFALAINLAAAYVAETPRLQRHPGSYLNEYRQRRKTLLDRKPKLHVDQYGASVLTTWETSYAAMLNRCPEACNLLLFMAFLSPDDLSLELLYDENAFNGHAQWLLTETSSTSVLEVLDSSFESLRSYSLAMWHDEQSSYSMHKLVHAWSFERTEIISKIWYCQTVLDFLNDSAWSMTGQPDRSARMISHIMACFAKVCELNTQSCVAKTCMMSSLRNMAGWLENFGETNLACELYSFVYDHHRRGICQDQDGYYGSVSDLGRILMTQGRHREAMELLQPALAQSRELCSRNYEPGFAIARELGEALGSLGRYAEAEALLRFSLGETGTLQGRLRIMRRLARVLSGLNKDEEAEELSRQAFDGMEELWGPTDPETLFTMLEYMQVLNTSGQYEKSLALTGDAMGRFMAEFGPQNPNTLDCMLFCGTTFRLLGDFNQAHRVLRQAMSGLERTQGMNHVNTLFCVFEIALCLRAQGFYEEALELLQRASDGHAAALGLDHPRSRYCSSEMVAVRSFLQGRAALCEVLKQVSAQFDTCLQAGQHLRMPVCARGRALTCPGTISRQNQTLVQQEEGEDSDESEWETVSNAVSDTGSDVAQIYGREWVRSV